MQTGNYGTCTIVVKDPSSVKTESKTNKTTNTNTNNSNKTNTNTTTNQNNNTQTQTPAPTQTPSQNNNLQVPDVPQEEPNEEVVKYTVSFYVDGALWASHEVEEGTSINTMPSNPSKYGYTFRGWYNRGQEVSANTLVNEDISINAEWDTYTLELETIEGDIYSPNRILKVYKNGEEVTVNAVYGNLNGKEDYTLGTWNKSLNGVRIFSYGQMNLASEYMVSLTSGVKVYAYELS